MILSPFSRRVEIECAVDIEQSAESFHAHAVPEGIAIRPGDVVQIHDAPTEIAFGAHVACRCRATVIRAGWLRRTWTRMSDIFDITELYEVGFAPREAQ